MLLDRDSFGVETCLGLHQTVIILGAVLRGYSSLLGSALIASITVISLAMLAAAASQWAAGVRDLAERAAAFSVPPRMTLEPLGQCNATGWLEAVLKVEPVTSGFEPLAVEVYSAEDGKLLYSRLFGANRTTIVDIPCRGFVELVVIGENGGIWLYRYELDPSKPCLNGARINGKELLQNSTSCLTGLNSARIVAEQAAQKAVREVLLIQYGPVLQPVWAAGPLLPGASPVYAAASGPLPGAYVDPEKLRLYPVTEWPVRDSVESSERDLGCCGCGELYVRRRALEPIAGGLLRIEHREARVYACADIYYKYRLKPRIELTSQGLLHTTSKLYGYDRRWEPSTGFTIPYDDGGCSASWISGGAAGSIYIPFLVTTESEPEAVTLLLLPRDPVSVAINETVTGHRAWRYCGESACVYTGTLALPATYVSVKLHLLPPNSYDPGKLVVARGRAGQVDASWQARAQEALYTETIRIEGRSVARLDHPVAVTITIGPELVKRLGPTATAAVAVVEVSYAAWAGSWASRFLYPLGGYAMVGTELLLYIAHSHSEAAAAGELLAPATLRLEPVAEAQPVERIVLERKAYTASRTIADRLYYGTYYSTFTITYNETLVLEDPGLVLYTVEPGSQLTVSIASTQPSGEPVELDYTATRIPFPKSIIQEVLEKGAKPLILT